ncbi:MAG: DUF5018 domain-containing protein [Leadbetterella sp.]|nr:DUF5018 domain-containing protein [Leadbetterella sp.]
MKNQFKVLIWCILAGISFYACDKKEPTPTPTTPTTPGGTTPPGGTTSKSSAKAISKFSFAGLSPAVEGTIDETAKTIKATVPATADITKLAPSVTVSAKATVSPATGVTQDFSKDVTYTVTAEDGTVQAYKVSVSKTGGTSGVTTITITEKKATMPTISDMDYSNAWGGILFALNSKLYYLGRSRSNGGLDFKYFFEYDPSADKWTQKEDFPFKHNGTNTSENYANTSFIHGGKAFIANANHSFFTYDPATNKWTDAGFGFSSLSNDWTSYSEGKLYGVTGLLSNAFVVDMTDKTARNYPMKVRQRFNAGTTFYANKKLYSVVTTDINGVIQTGKLEVYEVDYVNGNYIAKSSYDASAFTARNVNFTAQVGNRMYFFLNGNILIYDAATDKWERVEKQTFGGGKLTATIGKTIYSMNEYNKLIAIQTPE